MAGLLRLLVGCLVVWWDHFGYRQAASLYRKGTTREVATCCGSCWSLNKYTDPPPRAHLSPRTPAVVGFPGRRSRTLKPLIKHFMTKKRSTPSCAQESAQSYAQDKTWKGNQLSCWTFLWKYDSKKSSKSAFHSRPSSGWLAWGRPRSSPKKTHWHMLELSTMRSHWVSGHPRPPHHGGHPRLPRCDSALLHSAKLPCNNQIQANLDLNTNESIASTSPWDSGTTGDWLLHTCTSCLSYASRTASSVVNISFKKIGSSSHFLTSHILQNCYRLIGRPRRAWLRGLTCPADLSPAPMTGKWRVKWL